MNDNLTQEILLQLATKRDGNRERDHERPEQVLPCRAPPWRALQVLVASPAEAQQERLPNGEEVLLHINLLFAKHTKISMQLVNFGIWKEIVPVSDKKAWNAMSKFEPQSCQDDPIEKGWSWALALSD